MKNSSTGLVYSTEVGRTCPECRLAIGQCACKARIAPLGDGVVKVSRQTKGRGGKSVTMVTGVALATDALAVLGKQLRTACGCGGTVKDGVIEVQGDNCEKVMEALRKQGYSPKRGGG